MWDRFRAVSILCTYKLDLDRLGTVLTRGYNLLLLLLTVLVGLILLHFGHLIPAPQRSAFLRSPFFDYRGEAPETLHEIKVENLPKPYLAQSAENSPRIVPRPQNAWPQAPKDFKVELYATNLQKPRLIRTAPNGDFFVSESIAGQIRIFRGITSDGKAEQMQVFASGLELPYGVAFYPAGSNPKWVYVANASSIVRFAYSLGDLKASGPPKHIVDLPPAGLHWTRDLQFSADGQKMYVAVGSDSNAEDPDTKPDEKNRADILEFNCDGSGMRVYANGIRNPGGGLALNPQTGELWMSVNERDGLGDNLVPDYITHVQEGGFYGWPWFYAGPNQDPHYPGRHLELKSSVLTPDVLVQPHSAPLELSFYQGFQFPSEYRGDIFVSQHGSWNRSVRVGYDVIRVPLHQTGRATGEYEDFLTGFVLDNTMVWGRPVGVTVALDGSLLITDDGSDSIWRVSYLPHSK
jgi:glucose/arabinose dehydrogenase